LATPADEAAALTAGRDCNTLATTTVNLNKKLEKLTVEGLFVSTGTTNHWYNWRLIIILYVLLITYPFWQSLFYVTALITVITLSLPFLLQVFAGTTLKVLIYLIGDDGITTADKIVKDLDEEVIAKRKTDQETRERVAAIHAKELSDRKISTRVTHTGPPKKLPDEIAQVLRDSNDPALVNQKPKWRPQPPQRVVDDVKESKSLKSPQEIDDEVAKMPAHNHKKLVPQITTESMVADAISKGWKYAQSFLVDSDPIAANVYSEKISDDTGNLIVTNCVVEKRHGNRGKNKNRARIYNPNAATYIIQYDEAWMPEDRDWSYFENPYELNNTRSGEINGEIYIGNQDLHNAVQTAIQDELYLDDDSRGRVVFFDDEESPEKLVNRVKRAVKQAGAPEEYCDQINARNVRDVMRDTGYQSYIDKGTTDPLEPARRRHDKDFVEVESKSHQTSLCEKCQELGRPCWVRPSRRRRRAVKVETEGIKYSETRIVVVQDDRRKIVLLDQKFCDRFQKLIEDAMLRALVLSDNVSTGPSLSVQIAEFLTLINDVEEEYNCILLEWVLDYESDVVEPAQVDHGLIVSESLGHETIGGPTIEPKNKYDAIIVNQKKEKQAVGENDHPYGKKVEIPSESMETTVKSLIVEASQGRGTIPKNNTFLVSLVKGDNLVAETRGIAVSNNLVIPYHLVFKRGEVSLKEQNMCDPAAELKVYSPATNTVLFSAKISDLLKGMVLFRNESLMLAEQTDWAYASAIVVIKNVQNLPNTPYGNLLSVPSKPWIDQKVSLRGLVQLIKVKSFNEGKYAPKNEDVTDTTAAVLEFDYHLGSHNVNTQLGDCGTPIWAEDNIDPKTTRHYCVGVHCASSNGNKNHFAYWPKKLVDFLTPAPATAGQSSQ
jgi:hypothetical protein